MTRPAAIRRLLRCAIRYSAMGFSSRQWASFALIGAMFLPVTMPVRALIIPTAHGPAGNETTTAATDNRLALPALLSESERKAQVARLDINVRREVSLLVGQSLNLSGVPVNARGEALNGLTVEWKSSAPNVVSIDSSGRALAGQPGTARLIAGAGDVEEIVEATVTTQAAKVYEQQPKEALSEALPDEKTSFAQDEPLTTDTGDSLKSHRVTRKIMAAPLLPQPPPPPGDGLPEAQTNSLYTPYNIVGTPPGRTEPGAATPAVATGGTENPGSSNFSFDVPVADLPGRGLSVSLAMTYNSRLWHKYEADGNKSLSFNVDGGWPAPGFSLGYGHLDWQGEQGYTLVDPNGTRHQMLKTTPTSTNSYDSTDSTFIRLIINSNGSTATYTDGTQVLYSQPNISGRSFPVRITDRNGNYNEISYRGGQGPDLFTVRDTLGRLVRFHYDDSDTTFGSKLISVTVPKYGTSASAPEEQQTIRFYYSTVFVNPTGSFNAPAIGGAYGNFRVLRYVYFPGTASGYRYDYSAAYGMIRRITERRGMTVSTTMTDQQGTVTNDGQQASSTEYNYPDQAAGLTDAPTYTRRTDDWAGRTTGMPITGEAPYYTYSTNEAQHTSRVTAPNGVITATATFYNPTSPGAITDGLLFYVITMRDDESRVSQVFYDWGVGASGRNPRLNFVRLVNEEGKERKIVYSSYDDYNNAGVVSELGFDGAELRRTETAYETGQGWLGRRLVRLKKSVKIYQGGTTQMAAQVDYDYDATPLAPLSSGAALMHDAYFADPAYRGNLTTVTAYVNTSLPNTSGGTLVNTIKYDATGNVVEETVNCCRRKIFNYDPLYQYAYPTSITRGDSGQLTSGAVYDFNTGAVTSVKDENNQLTTFQYDAATLRSTRVTRPDGGYTSVAYFDGLYQDGLDTTPRHSYTTTTVKLDANREMTSAQYFDGRGAVVRTLGADTAGGRAGVVDIEYDIMGEPYRASLPYYAPTGALTAINPAGLWTTRTFDRWGRLDSIKSPSGDAPETFSETKFQYYGTQTTVTDGAGKKRRQITDAFGRVVRLDEPDATGNLGTLSTPAQPTFYEYDTLNNLIHVSQAGPNGVTQNRYFKYDSLSRLTHERQVEQGVAYSTTDSVAGNNQWSSQIEYNSQGQIENAYDARGIRKHFTYDGLNRVLEVSYTKQSGAQWVAEGTPTITYTYDTVRPGYFNNGRMTQVKTASVGSVPETVQNYDYDLRGRVKDHYQKVGPNIYSMHYEFNLADQLVSQTYPSGRVVASTYDTAGRLASVADTINQQPSRTLANGLEYGGHGGLLSETLGNGVVHSLSYNASLQLSAISLTKNSEVLQRYEYKYGQINIDTGAVDEAKNNGQVARVEGFIGGTSQAPVRQWQQRFHYDSIGRLDQAAEYRGDNSALAYQSKYQFDRWGNRSLPQALNGQNLAYIPVEDSETDKLTNRFKSTTGIAYDAAGNITADDKFRDLRYEYDANGRQRLSTPLAQGQWQAIAVYDGLGQRVQTTSNGVTQNLVYDASGQIVADYGAQLIGTGGVQYVMTDHQGSTRVITNGAGTVVARHDYQPFGEEISANVGMRTSEQRYGSADSTRERYAGIERDIASGLDHALFRKYDSLTGRWTTPDPYKGSMNVGSPQSFNRYSYVQNDPVNFVDPSGLLPNLAGNCFTGTSSEGFWASGALICYGDPPFTGFVPGEREPGNLFDGDPPPDAKDHPADDCHKFANLVQLIADNASSVQGFLDELARTFTGANYSSLSELQRVSAGGGNFVRFQDSGFKYGFRDGSNQVRHSVGIFLGVAETGLIGYWALQLRENASPRLPDPEVDKRLNSVVASMASRFILEPTSPNLQAIRSDFANTIRRELCDN